MLHPHHNCLQLIQFLHKMGDFLRITVHFLGIFNCSLVFGNCCLVGRALLLALSDFLEGWEGGVEHGLGSDQHVIAGRVLPENGSFMIFQIGE